MSFIWNSAIGLLLVTGGLLGLSLPFGKLAGAAGVAAVVWSLLISVGAGVVLLGAFVALGGRTRLDIARVRYFVVVAALSYAIPNVLMFSAMPRLGAGYVGIMFTLTPMLTLVLSILLRMRRPSGLGVAGILVGFAGALTVALTRGEAGQPASLGWVAMGLAIPFFLAAGNVYRTWDWPKGADPLELAAGSHLASALMLLGVILATGTLPDIGALSNVPVLAFLQAAAAAAMFAFFFRLQAVGGPIYLSQIGYVGAAVGLFSGTVFLGESYSALTWLGAAVIVAGVTMTTKAQAAG
ncbi:DMT family transporter [Mesorhizobium sp. CAU 1741]|uniref:DMT family transporter n=1 Tax=Mesorhizobium sp. CAU 1741 TaxID=3140366 RepID=UPI00325B0E34